VGIFYFRLSDVHWNQSNEKQRSLNLKNVLDVEQFFCTIPEQITGNFSSFAPDR
jgi:hypothetical protein